MVKRDNTVYVRCVLIADDFLFSPTGSTKEEMADPSQSSEGAELSLRVHVRKSIGELYIAQGDLTLSGEDN